MEKGNPVWSMAGALALVLIGLSVYSFVPPVQVAGYELKQPKIKAFLESPILPQSSKVLTAQIAPGKDSIKNSSAAIRQPDTSRQRILMVGESMIEGLMFPFMKYAKYNGHHLKARIWYGSRLLDWGASDTLTKLIQAYKPTFIMVSIGSNELYIRNIKERAPYVERIVKQLEGYNYVWIGPPNPKKDYGINDLIRGYTGDDRFFTSKYMKFPRKRDGVHPKPEGSRKWADSIAVWVMESSKQPINLKRPDSAFLAGVNGKVVKSKKANGNKANVEAKPVIKEGNKKTAKVVKPTKIAAAQSAQKPKPKPTAKKPIASKEKPKLKPAVPVKKETTNKDKAPEKKTAATKPLPAKPKAKAPDKKTAKAEKKPAHKKPAPAKPTVKATAKTQAQTQKKKANA